MKLFNIEMSELAGMPYSWSRTDAPDIYAVQMFRQPVRYVARKWLHSLDNRLPMLIEHVIDTNIASQMQAGRVMSTIKYWQHPRPLLKSENSNGTRTYVIEARNAVASSIKEKHMTVSLTLVEIEIVSNIPIAVQPANTVLSDLPYSWIDERIPNGVVRFKAGLALNMNTVELADYVFKFVERPGEHVELPMNLSV